MQGVDDCVKNYNIKGIFLGTRRIDPHGGL